MLHLECQNKAWKPGNRIQGMYIRLTVTSIPIMIMKYPDPCVTFFGQEPFSNFSVPFLKKYPVVINGKRTPIA